MTPLTKVMAAADAAARWHVHHKRKGATPEPYVNHLLEVASLVAQATSGADEDLVVAALLHDAVEDIEVNPEIIARDFGAEVAALVMEVTDDKRLPKHERKRLQVEKAPGKSRRAKIIKLADKTSNLRALAANPPANWPTERRVNYVAWAREVVAGLRGADPFLEARFDEAARAAEEALQPGGRN